MGDNTQKDPLELLRQGVELAMPDFRHYYRAPKKGKIVGVYASEGGKYYADVQPLRNDESVDEREPVVPKVEIPVMWGGPDRGVVCPPVEGVHCTLGYFDGDPNYPYVSGFRWHGMNAPAAKLDEFVIQLEPGVEIRIDHKKQVVTLTPENVATEAGKNWTLKAGDNVVIEAGNNAHIKAKGGEITVEAASIIRLMAPLIEFLGRLVCKPFKGSGKGYAEFEGDVLIRGSESVSENHNVGGSSSVAGNAYAGSRSGGSCPHR